MKYTHDKYYVYAGKKAIATTVVGNNGDELVIMQGMPRMEVVEKIIQDCPEFAKEYDIKPNVVPALRTEKWFKVKNAEYQNYKQKI